MTDEQQTPDERFFQIQKIHLKDVSFETPNSPEIFTHEWKPIVELGLGTQTTQVQDSTFEVTLRVTVTVKIGEKTAYLAEVAQAGIFTAGGFGEDEMGHLLGSYCPNILFPYAREAVSDLVVKGGFPPMLLNPVNFDTLYAQRLSEMSAASGTSH